MGLFRGNFKSKFARYPDKVWLDLPERLPNKRNVLGSQLGNNATQSSVTGGVKGYGIELGEWITYAINQGWISITGADTNFANTNFTTTESRAHTIGAGTSFSITDFGNTSGGLLINSASSLVVLGKNNDGAIGYLRFNGSAVDLDAYDGVAIRMGDITASGNSNVFEIDDSVSAAFQFNGFDLVADSTASYANDAAASAGGVIVGEHYFNTTTGGIHTRMS